MGSPGLGTGAAEPAAHSPIPHRAPPSQAWSPHCRWTACMGLEVQQGTGPLPCGWAGRGPGGVGVAPCSPWPRAE